MTDQYPGYTGAWSKLYISVLAVRGKKMAALIRRWQNWFLLCHPGRVEHELSENNLSLPRNLNAEDEPVW